MRDYEWICPNCRHRNEESCLDERSYTCEKCKIPFSVEWEVSASDIHPAMGWRQITISTDKGKTWKEGYHNISYDPMIATVRVGDYIITNDKTFEIIQAENGHLRATDVQLTKSEAP